MNQQGQAFFKQRCGACVAGLRLAMPYTRAIRSGRNQVSMKGFMYQVGSSGRTFKHFYFPASRSLKVVRAKLRA